MKFLSLISAFIFTCMLIGISYADVYVRGYYRSNGTYVAPHYRSSPDNSYNNNWSVRPNVNPYTGRRGTKAPTLNDQYPDSNQYRYSVPTYSTRNCNILLEDCY